MKTNYTMKQINQYLLVISLTSIVAWLFATQKILKNRTVRLKGSLADVRIIDFRYAKTHRKATVKVHGVRMDAGAINDSNKMGDTITVYYLQGIHTVVQEHVNPNRYYWYLGFASILLIVGIGLFIKSLKGKDVWSFISKV